MGASSVTGLGQGSSGKLTPRELAILVNGPSIFYSGTVESLDEGVSSPPVSSGTFVFPKPLVGGSGNYVVMLTTISGGYSYVTALNENGNGDFIGFSFITEFDCSVMYIVASVGIRPSVG